MKVFIAKNEIASLSWAVKQAESWRGSMIGAASEEDIKAFDSKIIKCKNALKKMRYGLKAEQGDVGQAVP